MRGRGTAFLVTSYPVEVTVEHRGGDSMGTQPRVADLWAMKPRRAQTFLSSQPRGCFHSQVTGYHVCISEGAVVSFSLLVFFFLSSVVFLTFILYPLTAVLNSQPLHFWMGVPERNSPRWGAVGQPHARSLGAALGGFPHQLHRPWTWTAFLAGPAADLWML